MTDKILLSSMQKRRLAGALQEALSKRQVWYLAQITYAPEGKLDRLAEETHAADRRFEQLMSVRGLCTGDHVRIAVDGPYLGAVTKIQEIESSGRLCLVIDGQSVLPFAHEVELADEKNHKKRNNNRARESTT